MILLCFSSEHCQVFDHLLCGTSRVLLFFLLLAIATLFVLVQKCRFVVGLIGIEARHKDRSPVFFIDAIHGHYRRVLVDFSLLRPASLYLFILHGFLGL